MKHRIYKHGKLWTINGVLKFDTFKAAHDKFYSHSRLIKAKA